MQNELIRLIVNLKMFLLFDNFSVIVVIRNSSSDSTLFSEDINNV